MKKEFGDTNLGNISVDNDVIKNIALKAATEIPGVGEIGKGPISKIWNFLSRKNDTSGVKLEFKEDSELIIKLKLTVEYGVNIPYVAGEIQESVKKAVEKMVGLAVSDVEVKIVGMQDKKVTASRENSDKADKGSYVAEGEV